MKMPSRQMMLTYAVSGRDGNRIVSFLNPRPFNVVRFHLPSYDSSHLPAFNHPSSHHLCHPTTHPFITTRNVPRCHCAVPLDFGRIELACREGCCLPNGPQIPSIVPTEPQLLITDTFPELGLDVVFIFRLPWLSITSLEYVLYYTCTNCIILPTTTPNVTNVKRTK